jgi:hypothetical protein
MAPPDDRMLLSAPLGEAGSGMVRYAAAMSLYQEGLIGGATLEVFRICARDDHIDPFAELARVGLNADLPILETRCLEENNP